MRSTRTRRHQATDTDIHRQAMVTVIVRGTDARLAGRFKVEIAHLTKVRAGEVGGPGMDAHLVTQFRAETARRTDMEDRAGQ